MDAKYEVTEELIKPVVVNIIMEERQVLTGTMGEWITQAVHKIRVDNEFGKVNSINNFTYRNLVEIKSTATGRSEQSGSVKSTNRVFCRKLCIVMAQTKLHPKFWYNILEHIIFHHNMTIRDKESSSMMKEPSSSPVCT